MREIEKLLNMFRNNGWDIEYMTLPCGVTQDYIAHKGDMCVALAGGYMNKDNFYAVSFTVCERDSIINRWREKDEGKGRTLLSCQAIFKIQEDLGIEWNGNIYNPEKICGAGFTLKQIESWAKGF